MWIIYAFVAMIGSFSWYLAPKLFPVENPFSGMFWGSLFALPVLLVLSKLLHGTMPVLTDWKFGAFSLLTIMATGGFILSLNAGGRLGPIAVIVETSLILTALAGLFFFKESLNNWQWIGIILTLVGVGLVVYFEK